MFLIKKIVEAFVLPPGCLVVALIMLGLYLRKRSRAGAVVCAGLACLTWIGSTKVFSGALLRPLESAYSAPAKPAGDVIVVLCGGVRGGGVYFSASENLSSSTLERAAAAFQLHKRTSLPLLVSGGAPFSSRSEASAVAAYWLELGVPKEKIITEEASRDTFENAVFSRKVCVERGYKSIILLTSAFHLPRAVFLFTKAGFSSIMPFPIGGSVPGGAYYLRDWLPGGQGETARALNEYFGLLVYRLYYSIV